MLIDRHEPPQHCALVTLIIYVYRCSKAYFSASRLSQSLKNDSHHPDTVCRFVTICFPALLEDYGIYQQGANALGTLFYIHARVKRIACVTYSTYGKPNTIIRCGLLKVAYLRNFFHPQKKKKETYHYPKAFPPRGKGIKNSDSSHFFVV